MMKRNFIICFIFLILSGCTLKITYVPDPSNLISEPKAVIKRVIEEQRGAFTPAEVEVTDKFIRVFTFVSRVSHTSIAFGRPHSVTSPKTYNIYYRSIGSVQIYKKRYYYPILIKDKSNHLIYRLYAYQESDAKAFVDALHAMMNINGNAAKVKSGFEGFTLKQNDLPDGPWEKTKEIPLDNETTAKESALIIDRPDDWLRRFELWGRLSGYRTEFQRKHSNNLSDTDKTDIVISSVGRFKTTDGATEAFN